MTLRSIARILIVQILALQLAGNTAFCDDLTDEEILSLPEVTTFEKKSVYLEKRDEQADMTAHFKFDTGETNSRSLTLIILAENRFGKPMKNYSLTDNIILEVWQNNEKIAAENIKIISDTFISRDEEAITLKEGLTFSSNGMLKLELLPKQPGNYEVTAKLKKSVQSKDEQDIIFQKEFTTEPEEKKITTQEIAAKTKEIPSEIRPVPEEKKEVEALVKKTETPEVPASGQSDYYTIGIPNRELLLNISARTDNKIQLFANSLQGYVWPLKPPKNGEYLFKLKTTGNTKFRICGGQDTITIKILDEKNKMIKQDVINIPACSIKIPGKYRIVKGDTLCSISKRFYNRSDNWSNIFIVNKNIRIIEKNGNYIYIIKPGDIIDLPR